MCTICRWPLPLTEFGLPYERSKCVGRGFICATGIQITETKEWPVTLIVGIIGWEWTQPQHLPLPLFSSSSNKTMNSY